VKKLLFLILAISVLASVYVSAANSIEIENVTVNGAEMVVNFNTSGLEAADQVTLLTYASPKADDDATEENIVYIDQIDKAENTSISFNLKEAASGTYQVKMGGTDVSAPDVLSITVDPDMSGDVRFAKLPLTVFAETASANQYVKNQSGSFSVIEKGVNYLAAYASVPSLEGYTVKEYGIRLNGSEYQAKIELTDSKYAMIFKGAGFTANKDVVAFPYVTYAKEGAEDITCFGNTFADTLFVAE